MASLRVALVAVLACLLVGQAAADLYGSIFNNNRLNEKNRAVQNQNRLFDSQNNANPGIAGTPTNYLYEGCIYPFMFTVQHACGEFSASGDPHNNLRCDLILQYMCDQNLRDGDLGAGANGRATPDPNADPTSAAELAKGLNEPQSYYQDCAARERNKGLFLADQNPNTDVCTSTRQNPGATRYGFECAEERDYYPYWSPTPWHDIKILAHNTSMCDMYQAESENVKGRGYCASDNTKNSPDGCANWQIAPAHGVDAPSCEGAPWIRDNFHGEGRYSGQADTSEFVVANITVPSEAGNKCVFRIRYNISTDDYPYWVTDAQYNGNQLIATNPDVLVIDSERLVTLALNTNQYGRCFQDRSYVYEIRARPEEMQEGEQCHFVSCRGSRGNIVEVNPFTELECIPNGLVTDVNDFVLFSTKSSDYEPPGAGTGPENTSRNNWCGAEYDSSFSNWPATKEDSQFLWNDEDRHELCYTGSTQGGQIEDAPTHFQRMVKVESPKHLKSVNTRHNQFSNRANKFEIHAGTGGLSVLAVVGIVLAGAFILAGVLGLSLSFYASANPHSKIGAMFARRSLMSKTSSSAGHSSYQTAGTYQRRSYQSRGSKGSKNSRGQRSYGSRK